jgi:hypothetical protein
MSEILNSLRLLYLHWLKHAMTCYSALLVSSRTTSKKEGMSRILHSLRLACSCKTSYKEGMSGILHSLGLAYSHWLKQTMWCFS